MKKSLICFYAALIFSSSLQSHFPTEQEVKRYSSQLEQLALEEKLPKPTCVATPEEAFVYVFHPKVQKWVRDPLTTSILREIQLELRPHLTMPLTKEGFTRASTRTKDNEKDVTNYDAVWIRDSCWHYFGLKHQNPSDARKLLLSLLNFYASQDQMNRFLTIIDSPELADPSITPDAAMCVPLIRFSSKTLSHQQVSGKDQFWNHIQFDSHGLFLLALADAINSNLITLHDLKEKHYAAIALFPSFFSETQYEKKGDAGPWEEDYLLNASSAGFVAGGLRCIFEAIEPFQDKFQPSVSNFTSKLSPSLKTKIEGALKPDAIKAITQLGMERVQKNLHLNGEAVSSTTCWPSREPDAALLFLCGLPSSPFYGNGELTKHILNLCQSLIGPHGVYRYHYDAYQAMNFWIIANQPSEIDGTNQALKFITRFNKGYMPQNRVYDAQWFFDSFFSIAYYTLAVQEKEPFYLRKGDVHLKRALGQLTGPHSYAANGEPIPELKLPESINFYKDGKGNIYPLPSPITPLLWSNSALEMALFHAISAHEQL